MNSCPQQGMLVMMEQRARCHRLYATVKSSKFLFLLFFSFCSSFVLLSVVLLPVASALRVNIVYGDYT